MSLICLYEPSEVSEEVEAAARNQINEAVGEIHQLIIDERIRILHMVPSLAEKIPETNPTLIGCLYDILSRLWVNAQTIEYNKPICSAPYFLEPQTESSGSLGQKSFADGNRNQSSSQTQQNKQAPIETAKQVKPDRKRERELQQKIIELKIKEELISRLHFRNIELDKKNQEQEARIIKLVTAYQEAQAHFEAELEQLQGNQREDSYQSCSQCQLENEEQSTKGMTNNDNSSYNHLASELMKLQMELAENQKEMARVRDDRSSLQAELEEFRLSNRKMSEQVGYLAEKIAEKNKTIEQLVQIIDREVV